MNQSSNPNSLRDLIRVENSNLDEIGVVEVDGNYYVTESSIDSFMEENGISSKSQLIESLIDFNNIPDISIIGESVEDETLSDVRDVLMIYEDIHPTAIAKATSGDMMLKADMVRMAEVITKGKFNSIVALTRYIQQCENLLDDIEEEKKNTKEKNITKGQVKFSCMFVWNMAKSIFFSIVIPLMSPGTSGVIGQGIKFYLMATSVTKAMPPNIKGLYLSINDYESLLDSYEKEIRRIKNVLVKKRDALERKERKEFERFI